MTHTGILLQNSIFSPFLSQIRPRLKQHHQQKENIAIYHQGMCTVGPGKNPFDVFVVRPWSGGWCYRLRLCEPSQALQGSTILVGLK